MALRDGFIEGVGFTMAIALVLHGSLYADANSTAKISGGIGLFTALTTLPTKKLNQALNTPVADLPRKLEEIVKK